MGVRWLGVESYDAVSGGLSLDGQYIATIDTRIASESYFMRADITH